MKILAIEKEGPGVTLSPQLLREEAQRVWELYREGIVREAYFRADVRKAVLILEARDPQSARAFLNTLPLVESGSLVFEVIPLVAYDGFQRLFPTKGPA